MLFLSRGAADDGSGGVRVNVTALVKKREIEEAAELFKKPKPKVHISIDHRRNCFGITLIGVERSYVIGALNVMRLPFPCRDPCIDFEDDSDHYDDYDE